MKDSLGGFMPEGWFPPSLPVRWRLRPLCALLRHPQPERGGYCRCRAFVTFVRFRDLAEAQREASA